jgi:hypothetical protein
MVVTKPVEYPIVYVEWIDSRSGSKRWDYDHGDNIPAPKTRVSVVRSVGFLIREDGVAVTLADSYADFDDPDSSAPQVADAITIPKCAIKRRTKIKRPT